MGKQNRRRAAGRPNQSLLFDVKSNRTHTHPDLHQHIITGLQ
jgi:hypothetical protein